MDPDRDTLILTQHSKPDNRISNLTTKFRTLEQHLEPDNNISNPTTTLTTRQQHFKTNNNISNPTDTPFAHRTRQTQLILFRTEDPPPIRRTDVKADRYTSLQSDQTQIQCQSRQDISTKVDRHWTAQSLFCSKLVRRKKGISVAPLSRLTSFFIAIKIA